MIERTVNGVPFLTGSWPLSSEKQTIIFIHGAGGSSLFWKFQILSLSNDFNTIAIDLPGHGKNAGAGYSSISEYTEYVANFITDLKVTSPVICGLSMGGAITQQLLIDGKEKYSAGVVINSGAKLKVIPIVFKMIKDDFEGYTNTFDLVAISEKTDKAKVKFVVDDLRNTHPDVVYNDFIACDSFNVMDRLKEIKVPVLVLTADEDKLTPPKYGKFVASEVPGGFHESIKDAGHISPAENQDDVNIAIRDFINQQVR
jgi:pimeloyl-ACP methyl ester carboxylesterase